MNRTLTKMLTSFIVCTLAGFAGSSVVISDDAPPTPSPPTRAVPADLAKRVLEITDAVLEHHIDPPTRQQMVLGGIKALYRKAGLPVPRGLSRRISELATTKQIESFLVSAFPKAVAEAVSAEALEQTLFSALLESVPGDARLISAKERKVAEQIEGNRYVGLHIALATDDQEKRPKIAEVLDGGPAFRAGVKNNDLIEQIDGVDTKGMALRDAVDRLRGDEGTDVTIKVRQLKAEKPRTFKITRGRLPRDTVRGTRKRSSGGWDVRLEGPDPIGYLQITEITGSTPHELRKFAQQLESDRARALVLDLRGLSTDNLHPTVLLADALLDHGCIGRIETAHGETQYRADTDALLQGWPLVVLIDGQTGGTAEWLAAALQDNHRAVLVGMPSSSAWGMPGAGVQSTIPVGDSAWSITLTTGRLERGDGRPLEADATSARGRERNFVVTGTDAGDAAKAIPLNVARAFSPDGSTLKAGTQATRAFNGATSSKFGVRPDHIAGTSAHVGTMSLRPQIRRKVQELAPDSDQPLRKAVQLLRQPL
ncbi:MAG: S41 family peptidase [Isosphaeraceae bacterium]